MTCSPPLQHNTYILFFYVVYANASVTHPAAVYVSSMCSLFLKIYFAVLKIIAQCISNLWCLKGTLGLHVYHTCFGWKLVVIVGDSVMFRAL